MRKLKWSEGIWVAVIGAAAVIAAPIIEKLMNPPPTGDLPPINKTVKEVKVLASSSDWEWTGADVSIGDEVSVLVKSGDWTISDATHGKYPRTNGTGMTWEEFKNRDPRADHYSWVLEGYNPGALVAKIGNKVVPVGSAANWTATDKGELGLMINDAKEDLGFSDNDGFLTVKATVTKR